MPDEAGAVIITFDKPFLNIIQLYLCKGVSCSLCMQATVSLSQRKYYPF